MVDDITDTSLLITCKAGALLSVTDAVNKRSTPWLTTPHPPNLVVTSPSRSVGESCSPQRTPLFLQNKAKLKADIRRDPTPHFTPRDSSAVLLASQRWPLRSSAFFSPRCSSYASSPRSPRSDAMVSSCCCSILRSASGGLSSLSSLGPY